MDPSPGLWRGLGVGLGVGLGLGLCLGLELELDVGLGLGLDSGVTPVMLEGSNTKMVPHMKKNVINQDAISKEQALPRLEEMLLRGVTQTADLCRTFNVSPMTMGKWVREIRDRWKEDDHHRQDSLKALRARQMENLARMALNSFDKSRAPENVMTERREPCGVCHGIPTGEDAPPCGVCKGSGFVTTTTMQVRESLPGDPAWLKVAQSCLMDAHKIESGSMGSLKLTETLQGLGNGEVTAYARELVYEGSDDILLKAMDTCHQLKKELKRGGISVIKDPEYRIVEKEEEE